MMRSLYSAVTALRNHQTKMDVIGNNIANVNTTGFKKSRVVFQDILNQTIRGSAAPAGVRGGVNAMQVGLGMQTGAIETVQTSGSPSSTGKNSDLAIAGDGYFMLDSGGPEPYYTRAGNFDFDKDYNLVRTDNGGKVMGWVVQTGGEFPEIPAPPTPLPDASLPKAINIKESIANLGNEDATIETLQSYSIDATGMITGIFQGVSIPIAKIATATFPNPSGLVKTGENMYIISMNSGTRDIGMPGTGQRGALMPGNLEMSNVELAQEFTDMITTQRGFQANNRIITVSDTMLEELVNLKR
ncbi:flagellar hook-basal body complex protein [Heliophilum fasciatum]|uniref:Flagellar hook protein FlgE n=1 Tax=Heliophilum fasciatum TaxID=35700 RepID=A0A4R2RN70_9FIRM|nr:flagellar hook-basal body complex protein [Heliophilum fasciatum]MCW2277936.1 flagellar hook protein FlgE [Heliophilum fasciatum]TCP64494.1 flagellar hook protein FlgE [Heliophilum fasciatum]